MVAAIVAARKNAQVWMLEHNDKVGKKILVTGNGRCNLTNERMDSSFFRSDTPFFVKEVLKQFSYMETKQFFEELGVVLKSRFGYCYPASGQASAVLDVLRMELKHQNVNIVLGTHVNKIRKKKKFIVEAGSGNFEAERVIIATGSKAAPKQGSDGSGYELLHSFGHRMIPPVPALVQIRCKENFLKQWAGIRTDGKISVFVDGRLETSDQGELQLTDYGVSGIPVFQVSGRAVRLREEGLKVTLLLDFLPDFDREGLAAFLRARQEQCPYKSVKQLLIGLLPEKLAEVLMTGKPDISKLAEKIKEFPIEITGGKSYEQAQVCSGGVPLSEVYSDTLESRKVPGLYLAGEILDTDGICGGYNLQWAWTTGALAGRSAARNIRKTLQERS